MTAALATALPERERTQFRAIRLASFVDMEFRAEASKREFEGIAVPWDVEIDVDGWAFEVWRKGAFAHQLRAASRIKVGDGHIPLGGSLIGRLHEMRDDSKGLFVRGRLTAGVRDADEALALMDDKALDELSIGFYRVPGGDSVTRKPDHRPVYEMRKADLFEVALVPFGAYGRKAKVDNVRELQRGRERIEVSSGFRTVAIHVDGVEVASYRLPLVGEPVAEPVETVPVESAPEALPSSVLDLDAMLDALPSFSG